MQGAEGQAAVDRLQGGLLVDVEGLRIPLSREGDRFFFGDPSLSHQTAVADLDVVEEARHRLRGNQYPLADASWRQLADAAQSGMRFVSYSSYLAHPGANE